MNFFSFRNTGCPLWMKRSLQAAGIYNLLWGVWVVCFPQALFHLAGMEPINYPEVWQCVGMIVGVYGVGYLLAAKDPFAHWPVVVVGFLGKFFGPVGMVEAIAAGRLPLAAGWLCVANDLIWWVPFGLILLGARTYYRKVQTDDSRREPARSMPAKNDA